MSWRLAARRRGFKPLAIDGDGIVGHARGAIWRAPLDLSRLERIATLPTAGVAHRIGTHLRLVDRVLRSSPAHAVIEAGALYVNRRSQIWRVDLATGAVTLDFSIPDGRRALQFGVLDDASGRREIVFGEYFDNPARAPVRLWARAVAGGGWQVRGEFAAGEIEHVHGVFAAGGQVWIATGDFEHSAALWKTDATLVDPVPVLRGQQAHRAAWLAHLGGRLFYATDTQLEANCLYRLRDAQAGTPPRIERMADLQGSSIYCGRAADRVFFSTAVESGAPTGNLLKDMFDRRRGAGILSDRAYLHAVTGDGELETLHHARKDVLPFRLAQFGAYSFPTGEMPAGHAIAYGMALRGIDDTCLVFAR